MFSLATLKDSVRVHPRHIHASSTLHVPVMYELNSRFCNRVLPELGLCLSVYDVTELGDPYVHPGEAQTIVEVTFRLMIMRPFVGEVLVGRIRSCTEEGVCVSLHFFDDVFIPARCLQASSRFNTEERLWVWHYDGNDLFMDLDEPIRFRVLGDAFAEIAPARKETAMLKANKIAAGSPPGEIDAVAAAELPAPVAPYKIIGTIAESGLGLLSWWKQE